MFVERRKGDYDELQILAGDVRTRRRRANFWTTTAVATTMGATAAYVATTNSQVDALKTENRTLTINLAQAERDRDAYKVERNVYNNYSDQLAGMLPILHIADKMPKAVNFQGTDPADPKRWQPALMSNVVWYVDGSRRFPMTDGDVLWIPEASRWIRLEPPEPAGSENESPIWPVTIHEGAQPVATPPPGTPGAASESTDSAGVRVNLSRGLSHEFELPGETGPGATNCVMLQLENTRRGSFGSAYRDMVVTFNTKIIRNASTPESTEPEDICGGQNQRE